MRVTVAACVAAIVGVAGVAGCSDRRPPVAGVGQWILGKTELREAPGFCNPDAVTLCSNNGAVAIGDQAASVSLYFAGPDPDAKLVEIELVVRSCDPEPLARALIEKLGPPAVRRPPHLQWRSEGAFVAAQVPESHRRCLVHFVAPTDRDRIAELTAEAGTTSSPSPR
ncbi:MAG: hypothetical protein D6689_09280 [Deltaproteobacteria bacterium]|nr:MAG: hypothetical protein D6689_09280 [Deltaproteobacteria bacterium]